MTRVRARRMSLILGLGLWLLTLAFSDPASALLSPDNALEVDSPVEESQDLLLVFPHDPAVTYFHSTFGAARSGGRRHQGTDLMSPKMSPVYSVADGIVTTIRNSGNAGWYLVIDHGGGWESWYVHLNNDTPGTDDGRASMDQVVAPGIEVGSFVAAGQHIAFVGDSGNAEGTGPHTHFELHKDGRILDPYDHLLAAYDRAIRTAQLEAEAILMEMLD